jgi:queuine tRNA-ribosyltransferase
MLEFQLLKTDNNSHARRGALTLNHGVVQTLIFMPVGTYNTVKGVMPRSLHEMGAQIILGKTSCGSSVGCIILKVGTNPS